MLLCVAALPVAIVFQKHLLPDRKDEWGGGCRESEVRLRQFLWGTKHAHRGTDRLPLLSFPVNDFHEKASNKTPHLRNTSVRWCQRLAYSSSCWVASMTFLMALECWHGPVAKAKQVGSSWKKSMGPSAFGSTLEEPRSNLLSLLLCKFSKGRWWR